MLELGSRTDRLSQRAGWGHEVSAASELQTHVAELQMKALEAGVSVDKALEVLRQRCNALPYGDTWLAMLQHITRALATRHSYTDEALRVCRAAVTAGICSGPVLASASASTVLSPAALFPPHLTELLDRGAMLLNVHGLGKVVRFEVWRDGETVAYTARLVWRFDLGENAPRQVVCLARTGDFVCQSAPGDLFDVDPSCWDIPVPPDEIDREVWEQAQRKAEGAAR